MCNNEEENETMQIDDNGKRKAEDDCTRHGKLFLFVFEFLLSFLFSIIVFFRVFRDVYS